MIYQNAVAITEDGKVTYITSSSRHDFRPYTFNDGSHFYVDGGGEYLRRVGTVPEGCSLEEFSLSDESSQEEIELKALWGTLGKDGKGPLKYLPIVELEQDHVEAIWRMYGEGIGHAPKIAIKKRLGIK